MLNKESKQYIAGQIIRAAFIKMLCDLEQSNKKGGL